MPIDIENLNPSTKFPYPLPEEGKEQETGEKEWVCVRSLSMETYRKIEEQTTVLKRELVQPKKPNGKIDRRAVLQRIEYRQITNVSLRNKLMWDEIIDEIHIFDSKKILLPSTTEIKIKLMNESADFALYIAECLEILTEDEKDKEQVLEKNSLNSQSE